MRICKNFRSKYHRVNNVAMNENKMKYWPFLNWKALSYIWSVRRKRFTTWRFRHFRYCRNTIRLTSRSFNEPRTENRTDWRNRNTRRVRHHIAYAVSDRSRELSSRFCGNDRQNIVRSGATRYEIGHGFRGVSRTNLDVQPRDLWRRFPNPYKRERVRSVCSEICKWPCRSVYGVVRDHLNLFILPVSAHRTTW